MRLKAIGMIHHSGTTFLAESVFEIPNDVEARRLVELGAARSTSEKLSVRTEQREPTEKLLAEANSGRTAKLPKAQ